MEQSKYRFQVILDDELHPIVNMEKDLALFSQVEEGIPIIYLRFYGWKEECISYGMNQKQQEMSDYLKKVKVNTNLIHIKRPTGGGLVHHVPGDFTLSLIFPLKIWPKGSSLLSIYYDLSSCLNVALNTVGIDSELTKKTKAEYSEKKLNPICKDYPAKYEILLNHQKIVGSAQRKGRFALLQQTHFFMDVEKQKYKLIDLLTNEYKMILLI